MFESSPHVLLPATGKLEQGAAEAKKKSQAATNAFPRFGSISQSFAISLKFVAAVTSK
jgi:hypothetical protein